MPAPLRYAKYAARALLVFGAFLLVWALSLIFLPVRAATATTTPIQDLLFQRLVLAIIVLGAGVLVALIGRSRRTTA